MFTGSYMSSPDHRRTGEKSDFFFTFNLKVIAFIDWISASTWVMLMLLPCLQHREIQRTHCLKKRQRFKFTLWVYSFWHPLRCHSIQSNRQNEAK